MASITIAFCRACKWRSSCQPLTLHCAGAPCPACGTGISALHYDPTYTDTRNGRPYTEMAAAAQHLHEAGIATAGPTTTIPIPAHPATPVVPRPPIPISIS
jgi:hypothetical protein